MRCRTPWIVAIVAIAAVAGATVAASVSEPLTLRQLAAGATRIVRGSITDVRAFSVPGRGIESVATVAVEHTLKGESEPFLAVHVPGGAIAGRRRVTIGAPSLRVNQQAVFFLKRGADNGWRPVGLSAGVVHVRSEPVTGRRLVAPVLLSGHTASAGPVLRGDDRRRNLSVEEFEALVVIALASPVATAEVVP
jgi:hypothetical protein